MGKNGGTVKTERFRAPYRDRLRMEYDLLGSCEPMTEEISECRAELACKIILWDAVNQSHEWDWIPKLP